MATAEQTASGTFGKIPLGRRIAELMHEKGDAFSVRAFAERLGVNRETFRLTLLGERPISITLLENIAKRLRISEERLRQLDTAKREEDLEKLLKASNRSKIMMQRAYSIATELVDVALGATERGYSLNNLGRVQYLQKQYDDAHQTWLKALEFAKINQKEYEDNNLLKIVSANLMLTYTIRREYSNIEELLQIVEDTFVDNPQALGMAYYTRMRVQDDRGNLEMAKNYAYRALEYYEQTQDNKDIGHALINVAHFEYLLGEYKTAANALSSALEMVEKFDDIFVLVVKDYVKTLLKLREQEKAISLIGKYESRASEYPDYWAKIQIMKTVLTEDPTYAENIIDDSTMSPTTRYLACKCLFEYYETKGESESALKYYRKGRMYSNDKSNFYDTEGF